MGEALEFLIDETMLSESGGCGSEEEVLAQPLKMDRSDRRRIAPALPTNYTQTLLALQPTGHLQQPAPPVSSEHAAQLHPPRSPLSPGGDVSLSSFLSLQSLYHLPLDLLAPFSLEPLVAVPADYLRPNSGPTAPAALGTPPQSSLSPTPRVSSPLVSPLAAQSP